MPNLSRCTAELCAASVRLCGLRVPPPPLWPHPVQDVAAVEVLHAQRYFARCPEQRPRSNALVPARALLEDLPFVNRLLQRPLQGGHQNTTQRARVGRAQTLRQRALLLQQLRPAALPAAAAGVVGSPIPQ